MEWIYIAVEIILVFLLGLFIKIFLPSYMEEKGKNLATKEDIEAITRKTEEVQKEFKEGFELFSSDVRFKYDFYFKQYSELYSKLYGIIMQSEYVRHFLKINDDQEVSFDEAPFLEVSPTRKVTKSVHWGSEKTTEVTQKEERIDTPISDFNKSQLCEYIIENAEYATQKLSTITYLNQELIQLNVNGYRLSWGYGIGEYDEMHMFDKHGNCLEQIKEYTI